MQIPSLDIRPVVEGESIRDDEVEITEEQRLRIEGIKLRQAQLAEHNALVEARRQEDLASRKGHSRAAKKRRRG